ncbi:Glycosyltransferase involved in cell wall bisynthesis [Roseovarius marisflavi]|uniref:Glycosyltransferase involved in cell wall bisynthesis n=1 Tax=Roseovarius marisflavi TaxID=1054996 RepID=A0A1M7CHR1_9RHOB|nr:glycosyltransferase family 4 protein [Roseovarius marisflavi]SHL66747.1 Glycosyltransferase involved in cell wall bisynthesis [Roseovarius marisflavi]
MKVILFAPNIDSTDVGEALIAYKWAEKLSEKVELTVLAFQRPGRPFLAEQLPQAEVITWPEPKLFLRFERFNSGLKLGYPLLYRAARRWLRQQMDNGRYFDIGHQLMPQAARYPALFYGLGIPYVVGPLGGSLLTPKHFISETGTDSWFTRMRVIDPWRFRFDPWLRRSYEEADLILGVAPYMQETLGAIPLKRFEAMLELGVDNLAPKRLVGEQAGLRLLHVGRGVRTKGLRDVVRAIAYLSDLQDVTLTSAGQGPEIDLARKEAEKLEVLHRITFLGQVPHDKVRALYDVSDLFVFPSFREPAGGVLYEAMRAGLPVITVDYGGPSFVTDDTCAIRLPVSTPEALAKDIAKAVRNLYQDRSRLKAMGSASRARVVTEGLWESKITRLVGLYKEVLTGKLH